jgi:hypothetical protein
MSEYTETFLRSASSTGEGGSYNPTEIIYIGTAGRPKEIRIYNGNLLVYNNSGQTLIDSGIIQTRALQIGALSHIVNTTWTATSATVVSWSAGSIKSSDGVTRTFLAGNTGTMTSKTYIYYTLNNNTLNITTDFEVSVSENNILLAIVRPVTTGRATITPILSDGATINGDLIVTGTITGRRVTTASSGARVDILPDANTGIVAYDNTSTKVFEVLVGGNEIGNVRIGDYAGGKGLLWNNSSKVFMVRGSIVATGGTIGGFIIGSDYIQSLNYLNTGGLRLDYNSGNSRIIIKDNLGNTRGVFGYTNADDFNDYGFYLQNASGQRILSMISNTLSIIGSGTFTGTITASGGSIAGFTIHSTEGLYAGSGSSRVQMKAGAGFWAGATSQGSAPFRVTASGELVATNANISGAVTTSNIVATGGRIGGFTITATSLRAGSSTNLVGMDSGGVNPAFHAGHATPGSAPFRVLRTGALFASNANISGTITTSNITATGGKIGGFTLSSSRLYVGSNIIIDASGRYIAINSATWGAKGVQIQYNGGSPRFYVGDGTASNRLVFDGVRVYWNAANTSLSTGGNLTATNANISGTITSTAGSIAGWVISSSEISKSNVYINSSGGYIQVGAHPGNNIVRLDANNATWRLWAGHSDPNSAPFKVSRTGAVTCTNLVATGAIQSTSGGDRIALTTGNRLEFFIGGTRRASLRGATVGLGLVNEVGDFVVGNNSSFIMAATSGLGGTDFARLGVLTNNRVELRLTNASIFQVVGSSGSIFQATNNEFRAYRNLYISNGYVLELGWAILDSFVSGGNGSMYYNSATHQLRVRKNGSWRNVTTS